MYPNVKHSVCGVFLFLVFCSSVIAYGQTVETSGLKSSLVAIEDIGKKLPVEKLYVQFDKPYYSLGDVMHFKTYLTNADFLTLSTHSGLLYVELDDDHNKFVKRIMIPIVSGTSWGDLPLDGTDIPEGNYTLRAYTNWMRNFGDDYIFKKSFYVSAATERSLLVNTAFKLTNNNLHADLQFTNLDKQPVSIKIQFLVTDENKTLYKTTASTSADGIADIDFTVPDKTDVKRLHIIATEVTAGNAGRSAVIPVRINRPENADIKFMPEGGNLIAGLPTHVGFKAVGEDGKGVDVNGTVYNSKQQPAATFSSVHKGIGAFEFTPEAEEKYTVKVALPGGISKSYPLPAIGASGTTLSVVSKGNDSLQVTLGASRNLLNSSYYLIGQARGIVCYAALATIKDNTVKITMAKNLFPTGVSRFTLLSADHKPLNERMVYVDHSDDLHLTVKTSKTAYTTRDSVGLSLQVTDKDGKPIKGNFAVSVTDNGQVKPDNSGVNLANYLLLTSDLKGNVEDPGYYFANKTANRAAALDDLLLTETPLGYNWAAVFNPKPQSLVYAAETEFTVRGKVTNLLNKPVANVALTMLSKNPPLVVSTKSDPNGEFVFKGLKPIDRSSFLIQAKNKNGGEKNIGIEVNEFIPPVFTTATEWQTPWYVNTDTALLKNTIAQIESRKVNNDIDGGQRRLKEVTVRGTKLVNGSKNLNGPGGADQVLNLADMDRAGKLTLRQLLQQKVKGFTTGPGQTPINSITTPRHGISSQIMYKIRDKMVRFVIDGIDVDYYYYAQDIPFGIGINRNNGKVLTGYRISQDYKSYIDSFLDYFTAEDIKGIEVMYDVQYNAPYAEKFISPAEQMAGFDAERLAFIEITTRAGLGPFTQRLPGSYIYRPLAFTLPEPFYTPRYNAQSNSAPIGTDVRSTIQWAPNIITDADGNAKISFYSADKPGGYTLTVEGMNLTGEPGYERQNIKVIPK